MRKSNLIKIIVGALIYVAIIVPEQTVVGSLILSDFLIAVAVLFNICFLGQQIALTENHSRNLFLVFSVDYIIQIYSLVVSSIWRDVNASAYIKLSGQYGRLILYLICLSWGLKYLEMVSRKIWLNTIFFLLIVLIDYIQYEHGILLNQYCIDYYTKSGIELIEMPRYAFSNDHLGFFLLLFYLFFNIVREPKSSCAISLFLATLFILLTKDFDHSTTGILLVVLSFTQLTRLVFRRTSSVFWMLAMLTSVPAIFYASQNLNNTESFNLFSAASSDVDVRWTVWQNWIRKYGFQFNGLGVDRYFKAKEMAVDNIDRAVDNVFLDAYLRAGIPFLVFKFISISFLVWYLILKSVADIYIRLVAVFLITINFYNLIFPVPSSMLTTLLFILMAMKKGGFEGVLRVSKNRAPLGANYVIGLIGPRPLSEKGRV